MKDQIFQRVKKVIIDQLGVDEDKVTLEAKFIDDLGADSLDTVDVIMAFEEEFGCEISDNESKKITSVQDAVSFLSENATK